ncbi:MAG: NAD-glutamate dehydrogenase, partial [Actinomycetia bacterium]|nr:NAD-glutamate dehydrogenase [Actinomycetes bacterium]
HLSIRQLGERATRLLVRSRPFPFDASAAVADLLDPVQATLDQLSDYLAGIERITFDELLQELMDEGLPEKLAVRVASLGPSVSALDIAEVATDRDVPVATVAAVHLAIADHLELNWLRDRILELPRDDQWASLARLTLRGDLYTDHRALTTHLVDGAGDTEPEDLVLAWLRDHKAPVGYFRRTIADIRAAGPTDLTNLLVAAREVRNLIAHTS